MNVTTLSKLYTKCVGCGLCYYATSHLENNVKCKLCPEKLKDAINIIYYEELNKKIEEMYPRSMYDIYVRPAHLQILSMSTSQPVCYMKREMLTYIKKRIAYRTRSGEWKRTRKNRKKLVIKTFSNTNIIYNDIWEYIFDFLTWNEVTILYKFLVAQKI